jgi:hypothetical protein
LSEIYEVSSSDAPRCSECGAELELGGESPSCSSCGVERSERETAGGATAPVAGQRTDDHARYGEVRQQVASILDGLRPEDVDHAAEMAESIRTRRMLTPASALVLLVMLLPVGWLAARWGTEITVQRRVARDADRLAQRIASYRSETGLYPDAAIWQKWISGSDAPVFFDPWERPYSYSVDSHSFSIATNGADGIPGGRWRDKDVTIVFPYVNPRMAMPHAQPKAPTVSP